MSKFKSVFKAVSGVLGILSPKAPSINIPEAALPIPPAPNAVTDTGADLSIGSGGDVKNQRVSGRSTVRKKANSVDILGGLGASGLNI
jgi:hypothetical protein